MPVIGNNQLPYPNTSDEPNITGDLQKLAMAVDTAIGGGNRLIGTLAALQAIPNTQLFERMRATVTSDPIAGNNGEYVYTGGAWVSQTQSADWVADWGVTIHLERRGSIVTASGQTQFNGTPGQLSNFALSRASTFPAWAWPKFTGNYIMAGNNSQIFSAVIDGVNRTVKVSGSANAGYVFNVIGAWAV